MAKKKKDYVVSREADKARKAKKPGKRVSKNGNIYFESRLNRADLNRTVRLKKGGIMDKKVTFKQLWK